MAVEVENFKEDTVSKKKKPERDISNMFDDPELPDENDQDFREEMFSLYQSMGDTPETLKDPEEARLYGEWLKKQELEGK